MDDQGSGGSNVVESTMTELIVLLLAISFLFGALYLSDQENMELAELRGKLWVADDQLDKQREELGEAQDKLTRREQEVAESRELLNEQRQKLSKAVDKLGAQDRALANARDDLGETSRRFDEQNQELGKTRKRLQEQEGRLARARNRLNNQGQELVTTRRRLVATGQALDEAKRKLRGEGAPSCLATDSGHIQPLLEIRIGDARIEAVQAWPGHFDTVVGKIRGLPALLRGGRLTDRKFETLAGPIYTYGTDASNIFRQSCRFFVKFSIRTERPERFLAASNLVTQFFLIANSAEVRSWVRAHSP